MGWMRAEVAGDPDHGDNRRSLVAAGGMGRFARLRGRASTAVLPRLAATYVPDSVTFATKPALAVGMIERALAAGMSFAWVAGDVVYGVGDIDQVLRRAVGAMCWARGRIITSAPGQQAGRRRHRRADRGRSRSIAVVPLVGWRGRQGARLHGWSYLILADLDCADHRCDAAGTWTRDLLSAGTSPMASWRSSRPDVPSAPPSRRWSLWKGIAGRSRTASRPPGTSWARPQRDALPARLAPPRPARHTGVRNAGGDPQPRQRRDAPKKNPRAAPDLIRWSVQEIRRIFNKLAQRRSKPRPVLA